MDVEQRLQPTNTSNELHYPEHQNHGIQRITIFLTDEDENDLKIEESEEEETIEDTHEVKSSSAPSEAEVSRSNGRLKKSSDKPKLKRGRKRKQKTDVNKNNETQEVISAKTDLEKPEEDEDESTKKRRKSSYPCPHCHYVSSWKTNLEKHMMAQHTGERPYKCPHCEYASVHQNQLEKHWNAHHLGAVIHCSLCPFTVEAVEPYWKHMSQAHPGGRPVKCDECGRRVVSLSALELHILEKHAYTKPEFPCPHCGYRAAVEENQRTHIQSLHKCIDCGYRSDSLREVRRHRKREHRAPRQPRRRASLTTAPPSFPQSPPETNKLPMAALSPESSCNSE